MKYCAFLRGINVGGNNKVDMEDLKKCFEELGYTEVSTYINSGNVMFATNQTSPAKIVGAIEAALVKTFELDLKVVVRSKENLEALLAEIPNKWVNDDNLKTDVFFLWDEVNSPEFLDDLVIKTHIDSVKYYNGVNGGEVGKQEMGGAVIWHVKRINQPSSFIDKTGKNAIKRKITVRNINTVRRVVGLM